MIDCECTARPPERVYLPKLRPEDNARILHESERFYEDSRKRGVRDSLYPKSPQEHIRTNVKGFNGELLFSRWSGIPWEPTPGQFKGGAPDFAPDIEVRTCYPRSDGEAYIKVVPADVALNPDRRFYGIARLSDGFALIGWVYAKDVEGFGTIDPGNRGKPMYQVQPKDAHRMSCSKGVQPDGRI